MDKPELADFSEVPSFEKITEWIAMHEKYLLHIQRKEYSHLHECGGSKSDPYYVELQETKLLYESDLVLLRDKLKRHYPDRVSNPVGRPKIGVRRQVKMTLPAEDWDQIEAAVLSGSAASIADYFRQLHEQAKDN